jgi:hypothetical protein
MKLIKEQVCIKKDGIFIFSAREGKEEKEMFTFNI